MRRPRIGCRCFGSADFIRVPSPAAMTTAPSLGEPVIFDSPGSRTYFAFSIARLLDEPPKASPIACERSGDLPGFVPRARSEISTRRRAGSTSRRCRRAGQGRRRSNHGPSGIRDSARPWRYSCRDVDGAWPSGKATGFGPVIPGSNPGAPASRRQLHAPAATASPGIYSLRPRSPRVGEPFFRTFARTGAVRVRQEPGRRRRRPAG